MADVSEVSGAVRGDNLKRKKLLDLSPTSLGFNNPAPVCIYLTKMFNWDILDPVLYTASSSIKEPILYDKSMSDL